MSPPLSPATRRARNIARGAVTGFLLCALAQVLVWTRPAPAHVAPELPDSLDPQLFVDAEPLVAPPEEKLSSSDTHAHDEAVAELLADIEARWPDGHRRRFLLAIAPGALTSAIEHCVPPSVTMGQAIHESGWGRSRLAKRHKNLFGVKSGASSNGVTMATHEVEQGRRKKRRARFRTYDEWGDSVAHHDRLISNDPRYAAAMEHWDHWPLFLETVAPTYASDPRYVQRVSKLVVDYRLDEWDELVSEVARRRSDCG